MYIHLLESKIIQPILKSNNQNHPPKVHNKFIVSLKLVFVLELI